MSGTPIVSKDTKLTAERAATADVKPGSFGPERVSGVYAAYWQERSGFFTPVSPTDRSHDRPGEQVRTAAVT